MYSKIFAGAVCGVAAYLVSVEVDVSGGLPAFLMVGSLSGETKESRERVTVALKNVGLGIPPCHVTVNLSPADKRKEGCAFDLPIAIGVLEALGKIPKNATENILFLGELGLNGEVKKASGVLPIVRMAKEKGVKECIIPKANAMEGGVIPGITVRGAENIMDVFRFLLAEEERDELLPATAIDMVELWEQEWHMLGRDFADVAGQETAKRAAEIAAAGFHNLLMVGPPGAGKSMIAKRIPGILPLLTLEESLEVTTVLSVAGLMGPKKTLERKRPFQSPHHTISQPALIGGSANPRPGAISLAHRGILFLDELPEFHRNVLDALRQPLEERKVNIARANGNVTFPSDFMLVCAMNPCPCGYFPDTNRCTCTEPQIRHYMGKISGPILDRIDLCVEMKAVDYSSLQGRTQECSADIRKRVEAARQMQDERFQGTRYRFNADMDASVIKRYCQLGPEEQRCMEKLYGTLHLSARAYHRILKVARTIADLEGAEQIAVEHLMEAAFYRPSPGQM